MYHRLIDIAEKRATTGDAGLTREDKAVMMTVPFLLTAEQIGPGFPETYKQRILAIRKTQGADLRRQLSDLFTAVESNAFVPALTVVENAIFGRVSIMAGARAAQVEDVVAEVLDEHGLRRRVASIMYDLPTGLGGANLPTVLQERAAFSRAGIKRPDILIIDNALASHDAQSRHDARERLRTLMPDSIIFFLENHFENPAAYDLFVEIRNGRIDDLERYDLPEEAPEYASDLEIKLQVIGATALFSGLDRRHQRLLAFSASWYDAEPGQVIFAHDDPADAAYLCTQGQAELRWPTSVADTPPVSVVEPGRLIGDLSVILGEPRQLDLVATAPSRFLRIGAEEFRAVIENDAEVAVNLLETVSRNLTDLAELLHAANIDLSELTRSDKGRRSLQETARGLNG
jgi:putative ABC transport system ATP-binding protein